MASQTQQVEDRAEPAWRRLPSEERGQRKGAELWGHATFPHEGAGAAGSLWG